jgi:hypothetical protein
VLVNIAECNANLLVLINQCEVLTVSVSKKRASDRRSSANENCLSTGMCKHDSCSTLGCTCSWWKTGTGVPEPEWRTTERKVITSERYCEAEGERKARLRKLRPYRSAIAAAEILHLGFFVWLHSPSSPIWRHRVFAPVPNWSNIWKTSDDEVSMVLICGSVISVDSYVVTDMGNYVNFGEMVWST